MENGKTAVPPSSILDPPSAVPGRLSDSRPITRSSRQSSNSSADPRKPSIGNGSPWKTLAALVFVLAVIVVGARLWKKHGPGVSAPLPAEVLQVLGKRQLDSRQTIHLVRLGTRVLVLGSTAAGLRTLAEVTDPVEVDYLAGLCRQNTPEGNAAVSFRALFSRHSSADTNSQPTESLHQTHQGEFSQAGPSPGDIHEHAGLISEEAHV